MPTAHALGTPRGPMQALPLTRPELTAWLALAAARALAPSALRALLGAFGLPQVLRAQPFEALAAVAGEAAARAVLAPLPPGFDDALTAVVAWRAQPGRALVTLADPAYPPSLLRVHDPPPLLYVCGRLELLHAPGIAIVGSRNATPQGIEDAAYFARTLAKAGLVVVSGLALGIDGAAHHAALAADGGTVAVIGTGIDLVYPAKHRALAHAIAARGAIVSEWPLGTRARPAHFPQRNRLIAGLVRGVLVVEAASRSGSLITARLANEAGRDVFALPGSIHAPLARGCHRLIKDGAKLTESPQDILDEFGMAGTETQLRESAGLAVAGNTSAVAKQGAPAVIGTLSRHAREGIGNERSMKTAQPAGSAVRSNVHRSGRRSARGELGAWPCGAELPAQTTADERKRQRTGPEPGPTSAARLLRHAVTSQARTAASQTPRALGQAASQVLQALGHAPATLEVLAARTGLEGATLQAALLELEFAGLANALPGGRYARGSAV